MNLRLALYYFLVFQNYKLNHTSGKDERNLDFSENHTPNELENKTICELNYKKKLLDLFKSKHISISDKLDKINEHKIEIQTQTNILNGGFLDDW
jgi:hypothetical protein